jgi:hypothetical protein
MCWMLIHGKSTPITEDSQPEIIYGYRPAMAPSLIENQSKWVELYEGCCAGSIAELRSIQTFETIVSFIEKHSDKFMKDIKYLH